MTIRQPIETWTRPQLEDQYHAVYEQLQESKKKIQELDKELIKYNTRIRRTLLEKKSKDEEMVEKAKYDEVVRDNEILAMKLKTAKHQLLVYTTPSARPVTALSIITGRSTYRPISTVRRQPNTGAYATVTDRGAIEYEPTDPVQQHTIGARDPTVRITEAVVSEKATIIRLNRALKEKNQQIADLQFQLNRLSTQNEQLLSSKLEHRPKYSKDETKFDSDNECSNQENGNTERELENGSGDGIGKTMTGQGRNSDRHRTEARLEMMQKELLILRNECEVLKDANERLVRESLSRDFDAGATEQIELKKEIARLEEKVREAETRENEANRRRKEMAEQMKRIESRKTPEQTKIIESTTRHEQNLEALRQAEIEEREMEIEERREKQKRKKNGWKGESRRNGDVLEKLYRDVTGLLESYDRNAGGSIDEFDGEQANSVAKWRQMYAELYDELEKIAIMQEERVRALALFEKKMEEMSDQINEKSKKIYQLEDEIRTIAYSGQVALPVKIDQAPSSPPASNDISLHLSNISFSSSVSALNSFFVTLEFFDFELQTTPVMQWRSQAIDFTTVYNVLLSNLFVYYLESNGISVEIYSPKGTKCELVAAGVISLKRLLKAPKGKSKQMQ
ncbi:hypothetical protein WR25_03937 [Diploscapter pachys]|uniref:RPGR-interacting protein 1 first C2 domain-containing protein n=1 Tax=Diploscapter pachys TaxID=2018661 RepID=A0A2A2J1T1_9BILA|nr:hypothetical protein WR25_03937 [Diploscapter pachys]